MINNHNQPSPSFNLSEGLEHSDLRRLIHNELHIDEFKSKLGDDADVVVLSFKVAGRQPAEDLVAFIEKGYSWVIDADISSGEMDDGDYIVFVELGRDSECAQNIFDLLDDLRNLTDQELSAWRVRYYKEHKETSLSLENLKSLIPDSPEAYNKKYGQEPIDDLKTAAGLPVDTRAPKNDFTESLRTAAGIR
jgi:hypothetical protein